MPLKKEIASEENLLAELTALEQRLHHPSFRRNTPELSLLLADDFREFGKSGQVYDKPAILALLANEPQTNEPQPPIASEDFALTLIAPEAALLTYRSTSSGVTALRSSLWVRRSEGWQMLFHQGTPVP